MKNAPTPNDQPTEALFTIVRSEVGEYIRNSSYHLDFSNPALKPIARSAYRTRGLQGSEVLAFEHAIEDKYLKNCDPENPLHFISIWWTRAYFAKSRLMEHYSKYSRPSVQQTDAHRNAALSYAVRMLECDLKILTSSLLKSYMWLAELYFPFLGYVHVLQDLRKRPTVEHAEQIWQIVSDSHEARFGRWQQQDSSMPDNPLFKMFARMVLSAWEAREAMNIGKKPLEPPSMVAKMRYRMANMTPESGAQLGSGNGNLEQRSAYVGFNFDDFLPVPMDFNSYGDEQLYGIPDQAPAISAQELYPDVLGHAVTDGALSGSDWPNLEWNGFPTLTRTW